MKVAFWNGSIFFGGGGLVSATMRRAMAPELSIRRRLPGAFCSAAASLPPPIQQHLILLPTAEILRQLKLGALAFQLLAIAAAG